MIRTLTRREYQVAVGLACGRTNREIADTLGINIKTVDTFRGKALRKLGLRNNVELARRAIQEGVVSGTEPAMEVQP